jgi:alkanesulfonate monooxygenase SsuD/methylene tetrahydromethanopterin reductase-like flavin-dependent oxidoreductase (luciferase family)
VSAEQMKATHDKVRAACEAAGRDPASMVYSAALVLCCGESESEVERRAIAIGRNVADLRDQGLAGTPDEVLRKVEQYAEAGAERFYLQVLDITDLDHLRLVAERVMPYAPGV